MKHVIGIGLIVAAAAAGRAGAQCDKWMPGPFPSTPPGTEGSVSASTTWDPDGAGPAPTHLVVGGSFSTISGIPANNIAAWNGDTWAPLGGGLFGVVSDLTVYNGELVACGPMAGIVARWHLGGWVPFGVPLGGAGTQKVRAMAVYNGQLVVGGEFTSIAGVAANNIARWNGTTWQPLGAGVGGSFFPRVECLAVYNGELIAGGDFTTAGGLLAGNIARWNGAAWASLGIGLTQSSGGSAACNALTVFNGDLIAGGSFTGAFPGAPSANRITRWNGAAWQSLGAGVSGTLPGTLDPEVRALTVHNGWLVAGGSFAMAGGVAAPAIARWSDATQAWSGLGTGMAHGQDGPRVDTLTVHAGSLVAGGYFETAGGLTVRNLARWNSTISWHAFPSPWFVYSFAQLGSRMIAGGYFAQSTHGWWGSTTPAAYHVAAWDGATLAPLGAGLNHAARALKSFTHPGPLGDRELVCAGSFTMAGGQPANRIARWVEDPMLPFPPPAWEPMGEGFNNTVYALERFNESTFAAGDFTASGATTVNRIARWSGAAWVPLGTGLNSTVSALRSGAVTPNSIELLVGGSFTTAGGAGANRIARWVLNPLLPPGPGNGSWGPMGAGFNATARAIERHNGATYAAGDFTASGTTPLNRIARWTGSAWVDVGGGFNAPVTALKSSGGFLYAAGAFTTAGGVPAPYVARWDGAAWSSVKSGADSTIDALGVYQNEVHAGGAFSEVSNGVGSPVSSPGWARYTPDGHPWVALQPAPEQAACGGDAYFTASSAPGYGALQCQWRKDGMALANGPTGTGSSISGATSVVTAGSPIHFHVYDASSADEGAYDCQISTPCGTAATSSAPLTVTGCCYADCNGDSQLTVADFGCFQGKYVLADPYADCNASGNLTVADFGCFQGKYVLGCP